MKLFTIFFLILVLFNLSISFAQDLVTDRPDFTESAEVVEANMIQVESGAEYSDFNSTEELSYPNALFRVGVGHNFEIRFGFSGWTSVTVNDKSNTYLNDLLLEAKYQLTGKNAKIPFAILLVSILPTGDDAISVGSAEIGIKLATAYDINDQLGFGVNANAISVDTGEERELLYQFSMAAGIGISDKLGAFLELFADIPSNETWQPVFDGGFTYLLNPDSQLDLYIGKGLNDFAPDLIIGGGFSFRFGY